MRTNRFRARRLIAVGLIGLTATAVIGHVALGEDVEDITVSEGQSVKKDFPALVGVQPPFCVFGPDCRSAANCKTGTTHWCDTADLTIQVPSSYTASDFFKVDIELTWADTPGGNDVNLYVYRATGTQAQVLASATATKPERVTLQDPPESKYQIVVANIQGTNTGYSLTVTFVPQGRIDAPAEDDEFGFGSSSSARSSEEDFADSAVFDLPPPPLPEGAVPSSGPRPVERPGPDGSLSRKSLVVLAAASPPGQNSRTPFIVSSVVAALAATALGVFLYLRGRHDTDL